MMQTSESWALAGNEENEEPPNSKAPVCNMCSVLQSATASFYANSND